MMKNRKFSVVIIFLLIILLTSISLSFAYFSANITGTENTTTITVTGGIMKIDYIGGNVIEVDNIFPQNDPIAVKTFSIVGENSTNLTMRYKISLEIESNTFSDNALKYKLSGDKTNDKDFLVPDVKILTNIGTGPKSIDLGIGEFTTRIKSSSVHSYKLELFFPETNTNQNIDQGKEFKAYVKIENGPEGPRLPLLASVVKTGDYINYYTPNFDVTDEVPIANQYSVFNGKVAGRPTNVGIDCTNNLNPTEFDGWVVLSNINGIVKLMSRGTPECYKNSWNGALDQNNLISRDYIEYINQDYAESAVPLDKALAETVPGASIDYDGYINQNTTPILRAGTRYFFATVNPENTGHLLYTQPTGYIGSSGGQNYGIRIVVTLKENTYVSSGTGSSPNPYVIANNPITDDQLNKNGNLMGYWVNWNSTYNIKLRDIPLTYNKVAIAFGIQAEGQNKGKISFDLDQYLKQNLNYTDEELKTDIMILKNKGQKVILAIGGSSTEIIIDDINSKNEFVQSVRSIIDIYDFDGIDINIENAIYPTYLGQALNELTNYYGDDFILTLAPQTIDVKLDKHGNVTGTYYELIKMIRTKITSVNMQLYNTGAQYGLDGVLHEPGTVDFIVAYADILKSVGLQENQIGLGMISKNTKVGYVEPEITNNAIISLKTGGRAIGGNYIIRNTYDRIGSVMLFTLNEDAESNYKFSNKYKEVLK